MELNWKSRLKAFWQEWGKPFLFVAVVVLSFRSAVADWNDVPSGSMKPTILEGDRIFVNKVAYDLKVPFTLTRLMQWGDPERGDVVVFFSPVDEKRLVKRVVGIPGDRLELRDNRLYVNDQPADYSELDTNTIEEIDVDERKHVQLSHEKLGGLDHPVMLFPARPSKKTYGPVTVPEGRYFMMGDSRDNSKDSRWFGPVERHRIVGRVQGVAMSFDMNHYYIPRWHRFGKAMP